MDKNDRLSIPNKIMAFIFILMILASFCFMGYRIITKSAYVAKELKQTQILSLSAIEVLAEKAKNEPELWNKFDSNEFSLIIDYKKIEGNWIIEVKIKKHPDFVEAESSVSSGWNSRKPQKTVLTARIFSNGDVLYTDKEKTDLLKKELGKITVNKRDKTVNFRFPDEFKECPAVINAAAANYKDNSGNAMLALKPVPAGFGTK